MNLNGSYDMVDKSEPSRKTLSLHPKPIAADQRSTGYDKGTPQNIPFVNYPDRQSHLPEGDQGSQIQGQGYIINNFITPTEEAQVLSKDEITDN